MLKAPVPDNEDHRLAALERYLILDTEFEESYNNLTDLAAQICQTPVAMITLMDKDRLWFKAVKGLEVKQIPRDAAFCSHAILQSKLFIVPDADQDPRFKDFPLVKGHPHLRFYAGVPLVTFDGFALGTLCTIDTKPRTLTDLQRSALEKLAGQAMKLLELHLDQEKLRKWNDNHKTLFSILAHDLRSPVAGIIGLTDLLKDSWQKLRAPEVTEIIEEMNFSAESLYRLMNNLLAWSTQDSGYLEPKKTTVILDTIIDQVMKELNSGIKRKTLKILREGPVELQVMGDQDMIHSILLNLLSNAIKFSPMGGVIIIRTFQDKESIGVEIQDQGKGMSEAETRLVFEPLVYQSAPGTAGEKGTGLGLKLCQKFAGLMNGQIIIDSKMGEGTSVGIVFPT